MQAAANPMMDNMARRNIVLGNSVKMTQLISSQTVNPAQQNILNIAPRNVGLILGFIVEVAGNVTNGAVDAATRTGLGSSNIVQNFTFTDLNNIQRINTKGAFMALMNSAKQGFGFGGAYAPNLPMGYGNNWNAFAAPASVAAAATADIKHTYYVPLAYSSADLRGAIYAAIVNATMNLQITLSTSAELGVATGGDGFSAVYIGNNNLAWTNSVTVNVYQVYLDQLPMSEGGPILPMMDLNTIYDLKFTTQTGLAAGQDFPIPYANFRQFLSTTPIFNNGGSFNSGSDVNYWALQAANNTQLKRVSANIAALEARQTFMADPPPGVYYFDHRDKPIDTISFGNMELVLNASTVNAGAQLVVGYESFQTPQATAIAGSLPAG